MTNNNDNVWQDVTTDYQRSIGDERYIRTIDANCWISVFHRMTGFGYREWETAIVMRDEPEKAKQFRIIEGDRREELATMPKSELAAWYDANIEGHRNSFESILDAVRNAQD